jgi:hypothetical protein
MSKRRLFPFRNSAFRIRYSKLGSSLIRHSKLRFILHPFDKLRAGSSAFILVFLLLASCPFLSCLDWSDDASPALSDDDDDDDDGVDVHQECLDNIGDCTDATSSTCELCPDDEAAQALWHSAQAEIGNVYCHSCGENEDGDSTMRAFSTGEGCLDEATILSIFCE